MLRYDIVSYSHWDTTRIDDDINKYIRSTALMKSYYLNSSSTLASRMFVVIYVAHALKKMFIVKIRPHATQVLQTTSVHQSHVIGDRQRSGACSELTPAPSFLRSTIRSQLVRIANHRWTIGTLTGTSHKTARTNHVFIFPLPQMNERHSAVRLRTHTQPRENRSASSPTTQRSAVLPFPWAIESTLR